MHAHQFSKGLFWDVDATSLDLDLHRRFIVERVLTRGTMADWMTLVQSLGMEAIKREAIRIRYLDKATLSFCATIFRLPISRFRCYKQPASILEHWNY